MLIHLKNLTKDYLTGKNVITHALRGVEFDIEEGEFVAIMGHSGSGKSTLMHIIGFLDTPTDGIYRFKDISTKEFKENKLAEIRNKEVGFVFQSFNLLARTSALDNVKIPMVYAGIKPKEQTNRAKQVLKEVGLEDRMHHMPNELSGGQQQKVAIARALVNRPSLILADEPTGNLDSKSGKQIMEILASLNRKGHTIIMVTHEEHIAAYAKRILEIKDGVIVQDRKRIK